MWASNREIFITDMVVKAAADTSRLIVPLVRLSTVGSRAFPAAASSIWNILENVVSSSTLTVISASPENLPVPALIQTLYCS